jgi:hypothetical protein
VSCFEQDIKKIVDELDELYEKRIRRFKEAADILCDLLEEEWVKGDGMPEKVEKEYRKACRVIGRSPFFD